MNAEQIDKEIEYIKRHDALSKNDKDDLIKDLESKKRNLALVEGGDISDAVGNVL